MRAKGASWDGTSLNSYSYKNIRVQNTNNGLFKRQRKVQKYYVPKDLYSDPILSDSLSRKSDSSDDRKYKIKRCNKIKNFGNTIYRTRQTHR